jgi:hypothetical protein
LPSARSSSVLERLELGRLLLRLDTGKIETAKTPVHRRLDLGLFQLFAVGCHRLMRHTVRSCR